MEEQQQEKIEVKEEERRTSIPIKRGTYHALLNEKANLEASLRRKITWDEFLKDFKKVVEKNA